MSRASTFNHVTGKCKGRAAETDYWQLIAKMFRDDTNSLCNVAEIGSFVGLQAMNVLWGSQWAFDDRALAGRKVKWQTHYFERKQ